MAQRRPARAVSPSPRPLGDEGDAFFLHAVTKANKFERVAKRRKNALGGEQHHIIAL